VFNDVEDSVDWTPGAPPVTSDVAPLWAVAVSSMSEDLIARLDVGRASEVEPVELPVSGPGAISTGAVANAAASDPTGARER